MDESFPNPKERLEQASKIHDKVCRCLETIQKRQLGQSVRNATLGDLLESVKMGILMHHGPNKKLEEKLLGFGKVLQDEAKAIQNSNEPKLARLSRFTKSIKGLGIWYQGQFGESSERLWDRFQLVESNPNDEEKIARYIKEIEEIPDNLNKCYALVFFHQKAIGMRLPAWENDNDHESWITSFNKFWQAIQTGAGMGDPQMQFLAGSIILYEDEHGNRFTFNDATSDSEWGDDARLRQAGYYFAESAEQGHARAQFELAQLYESGKGCEIDGDEALRWYKLAAEQELPEAEKKMADIHARGLLGAKKSYWKKYEWLQKATDHGNEEAYKASDPSGYYSSRFFYCTVFSF